MAGANITPFVLLVFRDPEEIESTGIANHDLKGN